MQTEKKDSASYFNLAVMSGLLSGETIILQILK